MPEPETAAVQSAVVPDRLYRPGLEARARILAELASRWKRHEPELSERMLAVILDLPRSVVNYHAKGMREDGLLHPGTLSLTRAGYEESQKL